MDDDDRTLDLPLRSPETVTTGPSSAGAGAVPPAGEPVPGADPVSEGRRIGPYLLRRRIGEGGMGLVWEADQQEPIRRRVALKMVKRGMDTAEFIARFSSERQALAMMNHPAIAKVLDAGATEEGRPYFVMEYVEGVPLNVYCDQECLSVRRRLELFIHVCEGVQHAHQKAIIHRDLKPSNVLVTETDGQPVPKIIDFGVAKALDRSEFDDTLSTGAGQLIGTPEYMSPEQTGLTGEGLDTRTDVYALGVLLYELLVGQRPFRREDLAALNFLEVLQVIREVEPPRPSLRVTTIARHEPGVVAELARCRASEPALVARGLRGDLDWITMKALEKDRERRYDSASALAEDVRRHLDDQPVSAGPPSKRYRVRKFVRRHRTGVAAGAVAIVAILLGIAGTTTGMIRAVNAERRARLEAETARQVSGFLVGLFEVADPDQARGNTITAREILDSGSERIGRELAGQPVTEARLLGTMGAVYRKLGLYEQAEPKLLRSLELQRGEMGVPRADLAGSLGELGSLYLGQARYEEAEAVILEALPLLDASTAEGRQHRAVRLAELGSIYRRQGRFEEADPLYRQALDLRLAQQPPDSTELAKSYNSLAILSWNRGRFAEAEQLYLKALAIWEAAYGQDHADVAKGLNNLALLYHHQKRYGEAEAMYGRAIRIYEHILGPEHPRLATAINNLALVVHEQGRLDEAEPLYRRALAIRESALGPAHPDVAQTLANIGNLQRDRRRWADARADYDRALAIRTGALGPDHSDVAWTLTDYGRMLRLEGRPLEAEAYFVRALAIFRSSLGDDHPDLAEFLDDYAKVATELGRTSRADSLRAWSDRVRPKQK